MSGTVLDRRRKLHICWGPFLIDVMFRKGSAHSNHGTDYIDRVRAVVNLIRKRYSQEVPVLICGDSGFSDQKAFGKFEEDLKIHYITTGKIYNDIVEYVQELPDEAFGEFGKNTDLKVNLWNSVQLIKLAA